MIINLSTWQCRAAAARAEALGCPTSLVVDKQRSAQSLDAKYEETIQDDREALLDLRWYRPSGTTPRWFSATSFAGRRRQEIERSESLRRAFFHMLALRYPEGPLVAPSGPANDVERCMSLARELVSLRDAKHDHREVLASIALTKAALRDPAVLTRLTLPGGVSGLVLTVLDSASYPSVWGEDDWFAWLRLVGTLSARQLRLVLGSCDLRGLVALGVGRGAIDFSSGVTAEDRQAPMDARVPGGGGSRSPVAYFSAPLLAIMHGERLAVDPDAARLAATHRRSEPFGALDVKNRVLAIDSGWRGEEETTGTRTLARILRHLDDLVAVEVWIRSQPSAALGVDSILAHAAEVARQIPSDSFKSPGTREELVGRARAYRSACSALDLRG